MDKNEMARAYELIESAKRELLDAIRRLEYAKAPAALIRQANSYCGKVETMQRKISALARA